MSYKLPDHYRVITINGIDLAKMNHKKITCCVWCHLELQVGDKIVSIRGTRTKKYHVECAKKLNIM